MSENRRVVAAREISAFHRLAKFLVRRGLSPNQVSVASAIFSIGGGLALGLSADAQLPLKITLFIAAILAIQLRLICNLIDGLMAVEGGLKTASGEIFNDVPDRVSDVAFFLGAGYAARFQSSSLIQLGWAAALLAVVTAYVRTLGAAMTGQHDFAGPMAKQHRMFILTVGCLGSIIEALGAWPQGRSLLASLAIIAVGSFVTSINRLRRLYSKLEQK